MGNERRWHLDGFIPRLDAWIDQESPSDDLRLIVTAWVMTRSDDPYQGARRDRGFDNLWYGRVPNSYNEEGRVVVCCYFVEESTRTVACTSIATLADPI